MSRANKRRQLPTLSETGPVAEVAAVLWRADVSGEAGGGSCGWEDERRNLGGGGRSGPLL